MAIKSKDLPPEVRRALKGNRHSKYRAKPTEYRGRRYDSKAEAARAQQLYEDTDVAIVWPQLRIEVVPGFHFRFDFGVWVRQEACLPLAFRVEDVTGMVTQRKRDVIRLWREHGPCPLWIVKRKGIEVVDGGMSQ